MKRSLFVFFIIGSLIISAQHKPLPAESLKKLKTGNSRFLSGNLADKNFSAEIESTSEGQSPYAIIVACSDSRVSPEIMFDESIGKLFVIRLAGNVIDTAAIGSIEYAVKYLGSSYLLLLGHSSCGAVGATVSGKDYSPSINAIAKMISPAYQKVLESDVESDDILIETIEENVHLQADVLVNKSKIVKEHVDDGSLIVGGGVYDISTGKVNFSAE